MLKSIPYLILGAIVPLIVKAHVSDLPIVLTKVFGGQVYIDLFSWWRAKFILLAAFLAILIGKIEAPKWVKIYAGLTLMTGFVTIGTSDMPGIVFYGGPEYYDGMITEWCYLILILYAPMLLREVRAQKLVIWGLVAGLAGIALAGLLNPWEYLRPIILTKQLISEGAHFSTVSFHSTLANSNYVGFYCSMIVPLAFAMTLKKARVFLWFLIIAVYILIESKSRSGMTGAVIGCLAVLLIQKRVLLWIGCGLIIPAGGFLLTYTRILKDLTLSNRVEIWQNTLDLIGWIGAGGGVFSLYYPQNGGLIVDKPHNLYLQRAFEQGWFGIIIFLCFIGYVIYRNKKRPEIFGPIIGFLVAGLANDNLIFTAPIFWCIVCLGLTTKKD